MDWGDRREGMAAKFDGKLLLPGFPDAHFSTPIHLLSILVGHKTVDLLRGLYVNIMTFTTQLKESIKRQDRDIQLKGTSSHGRVLKVIRPEIRDGVYFCPEEEERPMAKFQVNESNI